MALVTLIILNAPAADQYASDSHWFGYSRQESIYNTPYEARAACSEWKSSMRSAIKRNCEWEKVTRQFLGRKLSKKGEDQVIKRFRY